MEGRKEGVREITICINNFFTAADGQGDGEQDTPTQKKRAPILTLTVDRYMYKKRKIAPGWA